MELSQSPKEANLLFPAVKMAPILASEGLLIHHELAKSLRHGIVNQYTGLNTEQSGFIDLKVKGALFGTGDYDFTPDSESLESNSALIALRTAEAISHGNSTDYDAIVPALFAFRYAFKNGVNSTRNSRLVRLDAAKYLLKLSGFLSQNLDKISDSMQPVAEGWGMQNSVLFDNATKYVQYSETDNYLFNIDLKAQLERASGLSNPLAGISHPEKTNAEIRQAFEEILIRFGATMDEPLEVNNAVLGDVLAEGAGKMFSLAAASIQKRDYPSFRDSARAAANLSEMAYEAVALNHPRIVQYAAMFINRTCDGSKLPNGQIDTDDKWLATKKDSLKEAAEFIADELSDILDNVDPSITQPEHLVTGSERTYNMTHISSMIRTLHLTTQMIPNLDSENPELNQSVKEALNKAYQTFSR